MIPTVIKALVPAVVAQVSARVAPGSPPPDREMVETITRAVASEPEVRRATQAKPWWKSKAVWGGAGAVAVGFGGAMGYAVSAGDAQEAFAHLDRIATGVFGLLAIWGRIVARQPVH